ncbi:MAG TPA: hypothetical protein VJ343_01885 [archaeon]|nr:hypothetical protein [archaeon]
MKGDATINTIGLVVITVATLTLFFTVLPSIVDLIWKEVSLSSPTVVAKELAGLISISGAAPDSIKISYYPSNYHYDLDIENRVVVVAMSEEEGGKLLERVPGIATVPIDPTNSFGSVNSFFISKSQDRYEVDASWTERE